MKPQHILVSTFLLSQSTFGFAQGIVEREGIVSIEAEEYASQTLADTRRWIAFGDSVREHAYWDNDDVHLEDASGGSYLELLPDTRTHHGEALVNGVNFTNQGGEMAVLSYPFHVSQPGRYYVWARAFSTGSEDNGIHLGLDGTWPESSARLQLCAGKNQWTWSSAQRRPEKHCGDPLTVWLDIVEAGSHTLLVSMREDGFELDKIVLALDPEYAPEGQGPERTLYQPAALDTKKNFFGLKDYKEIWYATEQFEALATGAASYYQEVKRGALAINAAKLENRKGFASASSVYKTKQSRSFDLVLVTLAETDGESEYLVLKNGEEIGSFRNPETSQDYLECYFRMPGVTLSENDTITVQSNAVTNGKIPEGDGTAFSRGRWIGLVLQ